MVLRNYKNRLTPEQEQFVRNNCENMTMKNMAEKLDVKYDVVRDSMIYLGLKSGAKHSNQRRPLFEDGVFFNVDTYSRLHII